MSPVVLSGYYGFGNTGDEAILEVVAAALRSGAPGVPLRVLSADPAATAQRLARIGVVSPQEAEQVTVSRAPVRALAEAGWAGLLVSGGGGLLQERTSRRSLLYYLALLLWARARGVPRVVFAQGVGPLWRRGSLRLTRAALDGATIWVRDGASRALLEDLGLRGVQVTADPVFAVWSPPEAVGPGTEPSTEGGGALGVVLRPSEGHEGLERDAALLRSVAGAAAVRGIPVKLIAFQPERERAWAEGLVARVPGVELEDPDAWAGATLSEWLAAFRGLRAVVSARYHAVAFAALASRPALALAVDPKLTQLAAELGVPDQCLAPPLGPGEVGAAVERLLEEGRAASPEAVARLRERAEAGLAALARRASELLSGQSAPATAAGGWRARRFHVLGVPVDPVTLEQATAIVAGWCQGPMQEGGRQVVTCNPELAMHAQAPGEGGEALRAVLARADLTLADGVGLVWGARFLGHALPGRVAGADLAERLCGEAARYGWRLFLWGGEPGVAQSAAARLRERWPGLQVVGTEHGYLREGEEAAALERLRQAQPHLVLVGLGAPRQELWIDRLRATGEAASPARVMLGVGGVLDVWAGRKPRAPGWVQWLGLEWLYRTVLEPRRLRRLVALPRFVAAVLAERLRGEGERA
ncbi:WecB/TagA/CpsF family glycosyltransferase [Limnochorda pilosa]|uniref:Polysaccharide pyruvyl transferase domain-containing protein n=1 Tax=Limnochorda pilosa TaxID=1555112 RepID=A0A0K2SNU1_LIMPI|nr:WecB/TagA/CpsF family glycosyltransferase [Limnochorda pilosa]BAS28771.1 hypothetical protein LIP_2942 [Limnochorda pilosa]